ncbi:hypothetical protein [uncultured Draconibacterium sp.]|uniref:hypothetical protein n=1 Tax=uncultured Draconibacterium sp. TaxID=1573823 RepID=UPI0025E694B2|nr:hypothetical protein [uncultured Draconibacterium sp.]
MKILTIVFAALLSASTLYAQESFTVPQLTPEQEKEVLYNHVYAYFAAGLSMAKEKGVSPEAYGKYIGEQFQVFWDPEAGFPFFVNQIMFILQGVNPYSEMEIKEQNAKMIRFTMSNMNMLFKQGPAYGITYNEFLACSDGLMKAVANHMKANFSYKDTDGLYEVTLTAQ